MDNKTLNDLRAWGKSETGTDPLFFWIYAALALIFNVVVTVLSQSIWVAFFALVFSAAIVAGLAVFIKLASGAVKVKPLLFLIIKKTLNYGALFVFCFHSVALVLSYGSGKLTEGDYYLFFMFCAATALSYLPLFFALNDKRNQVRHGIMSSEKKKSGKLKYHPVTLQKGFLPGLLSLLDTIVWAITCVIFINSLFFQLYLIPSESMVPEYYVGTRVFTFKSFTNPEIPLSLVKFPLLLGVKRFDKLVLNNPRYEFKKETVLEDFTKNFLFMISLTLIKNEKRDEYGNQIAEPLIKRLIGMPGEKIMMVDDTVYVKRSGDTDFSRLEGDATYAYTVSSRRSIDARRVKAQVFDAKTQNALLQWDSEKNALEAGTYHAQALEALNAIKALAPVPARDGSSEVASFKFTSGRLIGPEEFAHFHAWFARDKSGFISALSQFLFSWETTTPKAATLYETSSQKTNLLFKLKTVKLLGMYFSARASGTELPMNAWSDINGYTSIYIEGYYDRRNLAPFPAGNAYLPENEYFLMGDNRYNSLDCRHWKNISEYHALAPSDAYSLEYASNNNPFSVPGSKIRGIGLFSAF